MILALVKRDLKTKYSQSALGVLWAIIQPLTALIIYSVFFRYVFQFQFDRYSYALYVFSGVLPWHMFTFLLHQASGILISEQDMIRKMAFPKIILLIAKSIVALVEMSLGLVLLLLYLVLTQPSGWSLLLLPLVLLVNILVSLVLPVWISQLSVKKRDLLHILPYLANFGIWLTPIFYTIDILPGWLSSAVMANPMTGVVMAFRSVLFQDPFPLEAAISPLICMGVLLPLGFRFFKNSEKQIVDYI